MAPPKDIARSYPKRGITADVGFRSEPKFCGDGSIEFNGSTQYLNAELSSALGDSFTIMAWVKRLAGSAFQYIFDTGNHTVSGGEISLAINTSNDLYFYDGSGSVTTTTFNTDAATWYHVAIAVAPGSGNLKIYADGVDVTPTHSANINITDTTFEVGRHVGANHYLDGRISDVRIYDETLTQDQIRELRNNPGQTIPTGLTSADLIHRYLLETDTNDSGATGNNLTANNSPFFTVDRPQLPRGLDLARGAAMAQVYTGRAVDFDGSADYLRADSSLNNGADFSHSLWVYLDSNSGTRTILNDNYLGCYIYSNKIGVWNIWGSFGSGEYVEKQSTANVSTSRWLHLAFTYTHSGNSLKLYIDGIDQPTVPSPVIGAGTDPGFISIGARNNSGSPIQLLDGKVAGVKRFNVALTQAQIRELYHNPEQVLPTGVSASSMTRYYPLSDYNDTGGTGGRYFQDMGTDGEPAEDKGSSSMAFAQPVPCPQLGLQQSASRISMQDTTNATHYFGQMSGTPFTNQGTLSGWFVLNEKPANGTYNIMYCLGTYQTNKDLLEINQDVTAAGVSRIWTTNGNGSIGAEINHEFELGKLQHVVVTTLPDAPYWQLWINGVKQTVPTRSFSASRTAWDFGTNNIGGGQWGNTGTLYGGTSHFIAAGCAAWNTVLSDSEIGQVYNSGVPGDVSGISSANLQVWWKCDDLTSFKDYSGNNVSGAVTANGGAPGLASFPENASGSTIVGDFSMKRKGVSVLNPALPNSNLGANLTACEIPNDGTFDLDASKGFSASGFMRLQELNVYTTIFSTTNYNTAGKRLALGMFGTNNEFRFPDSGGTNRTLAFSPDVTDSDWHHLAVTMDFATNTVKVFLDGVLNATTTSYTLGSASGIGDIIIGDLRPGGQHQEGAVACVKLYQATLSDNEIKQIYNADYRLIRGLDNE